MTIDDLAIEGSTLRIAVGADGRVVLPDGRMVADDELVRAVGEAVQANGDLRAVITADSAVTYGRVIQLLDLIRQVGLSRFAFGVAPQP